MICTLRTLLLSGIGLIWAAIPATAMETILLLKASKEVPRISEGDLVELTDGRLAVVYTRFTGGGGDDSAADLAVQTSADGGRTWSPVRILVRNEGKCNVMSVSLLRLKSGELLLFYLRKDSEAASCNLYVRRSRDELTTVGEPTRVTSLEGYHVVNNDRVVQLSTGRLIVPAALHTGFDASGKKVTPFVGQGVPIAYFSDDEGRTWRKDETAIPPTNQRKLTLQENGIVELSEGRLWMYMRTAHGFQYGCYSTDAGQHWSEPQPTVLASPCSPATIGRCPWSGQLVCVWNDYRGDHPFTPPRRTPLCLAASSDEGRTWSKSVVLESDPKGSFCYTSMTWGKDRLYLTYGSFSEWKVVSIARDWLAAQLAAAQVSRPKRVEPPKEPLIADAVDYGRSFINTKAKWNSPRFWVESRLRISDPAAKTTREYFQCGLCKSEYTFPARGLFHPDNYDFLPVFSQVDCVVFRRHVTERGKYLEVKPIAQAWEGTEPAVRHFRGRMLRNVEEISKAMTAGKQLVGQTEIRDEKSGRVAVIEFPIKTINWQRDTGDWQVDTGPVLLPDLTVPADEWSSKLRLAFVAFNAADWAEFLIDEPTPVREGEKEVTKVYHYMGQFATPARNVILAQDSDRTVTRPWDRLKAYPTRARERCGIILKSPLEQNMQPAHLPQPLRGIVPPMVTPLADLGSLDLPGVERVVEHILSAEVAGLFILGTTGEGPSLGYRLRQELIEVVSERLAGRVPLLVGVTDSSFAESVALAEFAADAGAAAVVLAPPYYYPARQNELARYVEHFAAESPLPVFLYNLPSLTKTVFDLVTLRRLIEVPKVVGLKDSSANMIYFHNVRRMARMRPAWSLLVGPEELLAESVLLDGDGGVCGGANLFPRLYVDLYRAASRGDLPRARQLHDDVIRIAAELYSLPGHGAPVTAGLKGVLDCWGICRDVLAEPFGPLSDEHRRQIRQRLESLGPDWMRAPATCGTVNSASE